MVGSLSLGEIRRLISNTLKEAGIPGHEAEAEVMVTEYYELSRAEAVRLHNLSPPHATLVELMEMVRARCSGYPLQYIIGHTHFRTALITLSNVFVPRYDTEPIVDIAAKLEPKDVLDVGCGSGAIAVSVAKELLPRFVLGIDVQPEAVKCSRRNAAINRVDDFCFFVWADFYLASPADLSRAVWNSYGLVCEPRFDLLVSNPPYIPSGQIPLLGKEVRAFEPRISLDGGPDGLDFIRTIAKRAPHFLRQKGWVLVEFGDSQASRVADLFRRSGLYREIKVYADLGGTERFLLARLR